MRGCVSSRQRSQSNCLVNAALREEHVSSLCLCLSLSWSRASLAHAPGATDSSGLGGHRAHAPVPTLRTSHSLTLAQSLTHSLALLHIALALFLSSSRVQIYMYMYILSPYPINVPYLTHLRYPLIPSRSSTHPMDHRVLLPRIHRTILCGIIPHTSHCVSRKRDYRRELSSNSPTSSDFGTLLSAISSPRTTFILATLLSSISSNCRQIIPYTPP